MGTTSSTTISTWPTSRHRCSVRPATISANATQFLSRFNLDLDGPKVQAITVDGAAAKWHRSQGELVITPASRLPDASSFTAAITYDGVPGPIPGGEFGGWIPTDDGVVVAGEPHGAATWFPANDHPIDKASFTFHINVPKASRSSPTAVSGT